MNDPHPTPPADGRELPANEILDSDPAAALTQTGARLPGVEVDIDPSAPIRYGFHACGLSLLVPANRTGEVMEEVTIYPIPYTPTWLPGLINHRGSIVPVFDLEALLQKAETDQAGAKVLVIGQGDAALGVLVTSLPKTITLGSATRDLPSIPRRLSGFVDHGYLDSDGEVWLEVDLDGFVQAQGERLVA